MIQFIKDFFSNGDNVSSKRVMGLLSFISAIVGVFTNVEYNNILSLLGFSALCFGLTTIDKFIKLVLIKNK